VDPDVRRNGEEDQPVTAEVNRDYDGGAAARATAAVVDLLPGSSHITAGARRSIVRERLPRR
jgi:hypothetical protein